MLRERLESRRLFMLLDRSRGALVCCVPIDLRGAMHLEQVCYVWRCRASETKLDCDVRPGSVLAL